MHVYRPRLTLLSKSEVLRYAGQRNGAEVPEENLIASCREALLLSQPCCTWEIYEYDEAAHRIFTKEQHIDLGSDALRRHLMGCHQVIAIAVTIGPLLEDQVDDLFSQGQYQNALLLDAAGSAAVEAAADHSDVIIASQMAKMGFHTIRRFSPGYGDWELSVQVELLPLTGGHEIGIALTSSMMLTPRKSITALIGVRPEWLRDMSQEGTFDAIPCPMSGCLARKGDS